MKITLPRLCGYHAALYGNTAAAVFYHCTVDKYSQKFMAAYAAVNDDTMYWNVK